MFSNTWCIRYRKAYFRYLSWCVEFFGAPNLSARFYRLPDGFLAPMSKRIRFGGPVGGSYCCSVVQSIGRRLGVFFMNRGTKSVPCRLRRNAEYMRVFVFNFSTLACKGKWWRGQWKAIYCSDIIGPHRAKWNYRKQPSFFWLGEKIANYRLPRWLNEIINVNSSI